MSERIIVGYDGTGPSTEAVLWAAHEAAIRHVPLHIVSCYEIPVGGEPVFGWPVTEVAGRLLDEAKARLSEIRDEAVRAEPQLTLTTQASAGPASVALLEGLSPDDLLVVGASGHRGTAAFWLGSTPRSLTRHSPCPVVVVRGPASRGRPDRVVVGVDGSSAADDAVRWAADEADRHHVPLVVVHGWWYPYVLLENSMSQARDLTRVDAECVLDRALDLARDLCAMDITGVLVESGPASALLDTVLDGDLLVVGSRGHGAIAAGLIGSTVHSVLERSVVPVVVVRHG